METPPYFSGFVRTVLALLAYSCLGSAAHAGSMSEQWRSEAASVRVLAENDAPRAYREALRLQSALPTGAEPADKVRALNLLARIEQYQAHTEAALKHAQQALEMARQANDRNGQAEAWLNIALDPDRQASEAGSNDASTRALEALQGSSRADLAGEAMLREAMVRRRIGWVESSVTLCMQAMDIAVSRHDRLALLYAHQGMAISDDLSGRKAEAHEHYRQMRVLAQDLGMKQQEAIALTGLVNTAVSEEDARAGTKLQRQAVAMLREAGAPYALASGLFNLSHNLFRHGLHGEAVQMLDEVLAIYRSHPSRLGLWWTLNGRSEMLQEAGRLKEAAADAEQALALARQIALPFYISGSAQRMAAVAAAGGEHKRAYAFAREAIELAAMQRDDKGRILMASLVRRYQEDSRRQEIDELNHQHDLDRAWHEQLVLALLGGLLLLSVSGYFLLRLRRVNRELEQSREQIHSVNQSLEQQVQGRTAELRASEEKLRHMYELSPLGFALTDMQGRYVEFNEAFRAICGYPAEELRQLDYWALTPREYEAEEARQLEALQHTGRYGPYEKEYVQKDGGRIAIRLNGVLLEGADGQRHIWSIVEDVSERKRFDAAMQFIAQGAWQQGGETFLPALARFLGAQFGVDYVIIDKLADTPGHAETVAVYARGDVVPNMRYSLQHTPCENVMAGALCCYLSGAQQRFPQDALLVEMQVESYVGLPLRDTSGSVLGLIAVMHGKPLRDARQIETILQLAAPMVAAELKRQAMEGELRHKQESLAEAQRIGQMGSWELNLESGVLSWSDEAYRIFEMDPQQFGTSYEVFINAVHPDDREAVARAYSDSLESRTPYSIEHRLLFADGRIKYVRESCETYYGESGKPWRSLGTVLDISGLKLAELSLKQALEFSESIINAIPDLLFELDGEGRYLNVWAQNPALLAAQKENLLGKTLRDVLAPDAAESGMAALREASENGCSMGRTIRLDLPQGQSWFELSVSKRAGGDPGNTHFLVLSRDVTERKRLESELRLQADFHQSLLNAMNEVGMQLMVVENGQITYVSNREIAGEFGYADGELEGGTPLLDIIHPDDRERVMDYHTRRLAGDESVPGSYELALLTRTGERREYETSVAVVPCSSPLRVITVGKDITGRKQAQRELELLNRAVNHSSDAMFVQDVSQRFISVNDAACRSLGYSREELMEMTTLDIDPDFTQEMLVHAFATAELGKPSSFETRHRAKGGRIFPVEITGTFFELDGVRHVISMARDISERKRMEAELRLKEYVLDQARVGVYLIDENARITYVNDEACRALGYSREELLAKTTAEIDASLSLDESLAIRQKTLDDGAFIFETMHVRSDGSLLPVEIWASTLEYQGKTIGVALAADITERKNAELTQKKLARALKLLSESGMLLVRAKNEQELLEEACRFAVEIGGYRMAWVGFAENDEHKTVCPVAQSGFEDGYLDGINVTWADTERGQGPIGIAIRTGVAVINHDFQTNQGLTPWREAAIRRGFRSSVALPLVSGGMVFGSLNIYSVEVKAFSNNEEVALLQELADNLALGIGILRTRAVQACMEAELVARERDFRSLADNIPDNIARWDVEGRYLYINPTHERTLGVAASEVIGKLIPDTHEHVKVAIAQVVASGLAVELVRQAVPVNGELQIHEVTLVPEFDAAGHVVSVLGLGRDMTEFYRMQDTIAAREQEFRSLAESSPDYIVRYDREGRTRYLNTSLVSLLGLGSAEEVMGKRPSETWPDGRFDLLEEAAKQAIESGSMKLIEMVAPADNGGLAYNHIFVVPEFGINGDVVGTIAFGRDITAIREAERRLAHFIDNLPGLVYIFRLSKDGQASFPYMSQSIEEIYGLKAEDVKDDMAPLHALAHPDDRPIIEAAIAESARTMSPLRVESRFCRPGHPERWLDVRSVPESQPDGSILWYGIMLDITERKRLQSGLQSHSELLSSILESSPEVIIFALNRDYRYLSFNRKHQEVMRAIWGKEIAVGMSMLDVIGDHPDREAAKQGFDRALSGENFVLEEAYGDELHSRQYWQNYWAPIRSKAGEVIGLTCFVLNISERKEMELAREVALSEAVRLGQLRSAFLAQMSHELRTPLNGILGYAQNLLLGGSLDEKQASGLHIIRHSGEHLLSLINGILDHAAIEADKFELIPGDIGLEEFLATLIGIIRIRAEQKNIAFVCECEASLPGTVRGDAQRLRQVLLNLLSNAVKFTDRGQVALRVSRSAPSRLRFEVRDTGIGIPGDQLENIFLPFEQVSEPSRRAGGNGLGLAISRKLVQLMGGDIGVESSLGEGSAFWFEIGMETVQSDALAVNVALLSEQAVTRVAQASSQLAVPPMPELDILHGLARRGSMRDVMGYAERLLAQNERYRPFCEQLRQLAHSFQTKALLSLIEQYREEQGQS